MDLTTVVLTIRDDDGIIWTSAGFLAQPYTAEGVTITWHDMKQFDPRITEIKIVEAR